MSITFWYSSPVTSSAGLMMSIPALLTRTSSRPYVETAIS
jgi:hypothetical protein